MKPSNSEALLNFFRRLQSAEHCQSEVNQVVELAVKIAAAHLRKLRTRIKSVLQHNDMTFEDLAIDCIANLFERDDEGRFNLLMRAFNEWKPPVKSATDAVYFFQRITTSAVDQQIFFLLGEVDPLFKKILESLNYVIKRDGYKKIHYCGACYIVHYKIEQITGKPIGYEELEEIPAEHFILNKNFLNSLFDCITKEINNFPAVHLNALVLRLKRLNTAGFSPKSSADSFAKSFEVDELIFEAINSIESKLDNTYVKTGKITESEREAFVNALNSIAHDLRDGGLNPGLYDYLSIHMPGLSKERYLQDYQNILEYLVKVMKGTISGSVGKK